jgi:hypothetical protein
MTRGRRLLLKWTRTLHIYVTMLGLLLVLFFAVTGFMLNHGEWFALHEARTHTAEGVLPTPILEGPDKLAVVERLRDDFGATGALDSFETDEDTLKVVFKSPGRQTEATIQRADGRTEVTYESWGLLGRLTDLHRGKATGAAWELIIDGACVLLLIISSTGLILWLHLQTRRRLGLAALAVGLALCVMVYFVFVP